MHALQLFLHRSLSYRNQTSPNHKTQQQNQQQQQQQPPSPRQRPQVKPRTSAPVMGTPNAPETYEYMSSKGVPLPEGDNVYDDPQESLPRYTYRI